MNKIIEEEEYSAYNKIMLMTKSSLWKGGKKNKQTYKIMLWKREDKYVK